MTPRPAPIFKKITSAVERAAKMVAAIVTLTAALAFVVPPVATGLAMFTAWRFGVIGYSYYEITEKGELTEHGNLRLLKSGTGEFKSISVGDKLQVGERGLSNVRRDEGLTAFILFQVRQGDCVIVLGKGSEVETKHAATGGWLKIGTTACGLFR